MPPQERNGSQNKKEKQSLQPSSGEEKQEKGQSQDKKKIGGQKDTEHMSEQEARMLLDGYRQEERMFGTIDDTHKSRLERVQKDW